MRPVVRVLLMLLLLGLTGCKSSQTPSVDPFFGRTTIPSPATGSISGQGKDPYYQATPSPQPSPAYTPGITQNTANSAAGNSGSIWSRPYLLQSNLGSTTAPAYNSGTTTTAPPTSSYPLQQVPQNYPGFNAPPANINTPSSNTPQTTPGTTPTTPPGTTWPGGNRYMPPGGNFNYQGSSAVTPSSPLTPSPNRISTPFFAGGTPNRNTIPLADNSPRPIDDAPENPASSSVSTPTATNNSVNSARQSNISLTGRSPGPTPLQPQPQDQSNSQSNNNYLPGARRPNTPTPAQLQNEPIKPAWRESTSFQSPDQADKTAATSPVKEKDASPADADSAAPAADVRLTSNWEKAEKPADKAPPRDPFSKNAVQVEVEAQTDAGESN